MLRTKSILSPKVQIAGLLLFVLIAGSTMPAALADSHTSSLQSAQARIESVSREFRLDGVVEAVNRTTVSAQTSGTIKEVMVDVDDFVEQGAMIVLLKDTTQQAQLKKAQAGVKEAQSHLSQAEDEYARIKDVFEKKVVSKSQMDEAEHALSAARARLDSAKASLEQAEEELSRTRITAPYSGFVTERHVEVGETVQPGTRLMTGVSLNKLRVNVDVPQGLINKARQYGKAYVYTETASVSDIGSGDTVQKVLVEQMTIFPIADKASNTFKVRLDLPEGIQGLFPGMFVRTSLVTGEKHELVVPAASVAQRSEVSAVYVIDQHGNISLRHVRLGRKLQADGEALQVILSGLEVGETVALDPVEAGAVLMQQRRNQSAHNRPEHDESGYDQSRYERA